jgi:hypothetical protein
MTLPDMSVIDTHLPSNHKTRGYTVEQMLAWGRACAAAEREACAKLCESHVRYPSRLHFADAIRARTTP